MAPPFPIPADVTEYVRDVFFAANQRVSMALHNAPNTHESSLDFLLLSAIAEHSVPFRTGSNFVVTFGLHFVGGGHHVDRWEVADIGVVVNYNRGGTRVRTKVVLLQSKRLYPREVDFVELDPVVKPGGYGNLALPPAFPAEMVRTFSFDGVCRYNALQVGDNQWHTIAHYEAARGVPVHYLLYHPSSLPLTQNIPASSSTLISREAPIQVGARVVGARTLRSAVEQLPRNAAPSYDEVRSGVPNAAGDDIGFGLPLDTFMSEQVIECHEGYIGEDSADRGLFAVFNQRAAPIAAAFRIDIDAPAESEPIS